MKSSRNKRGFTLIELLVVVLIIGIFAAVALPQYQKAVEKSRLAQALTRIATLEKVMDLYALEHGYDRAYFFGTHAVETDIDIKAGLESKDTALANSFSPYFEHSAYCDSSGVSVPENACVWSFLAYSPSVKHPREYVLWGERGEQESKWTNYCEYDEDDTIATYVCTLLYAQGWQQGDLFY